MERLRFGLIPDEANATLADDLARAAGEYLHTDVEVHRATDYRVLASSLEQGRIDFAWVPPVGAARLVTSGVVRDLALTMRNGQSTYLTGLFALRSSKIETPADLRGVRAAWVDRESASGYIVIRAALRTAGVSLVQAFSEEHFVRSHSEIARALATGKVDVGATCFNFVSGTVEIARSGYKDHGGLRDEDVRLVAHAGPIPADVLAAHKSVPSVSSRRSRPRSSTRAPAAARRGEGAGARRRLRATGARAPRDARLAPAGRRQRQDDPATWAVGSPGPTPAPGHATGPPPPTKWSPLRFADLPLRPSLLSAVAAQGYTEPTPIQEQAIPFALQGRDLLGLAQTGTGKTAAFALPTLHRLAEGRRESRPRIRCLVLTPTRELAAQIAESFTTYGEGTNLRNAVIFGGVGQDAQVRALRSGLDILVATPGRLLDLGEQGFVDLSGVEVFVLDEADRMLDMGFLNDVRRIIKKLPPKRQTLFFSATMPPDIQSLADAILVDPARVTVTPVSSTVEKVEQSVFFVERGDKRRLLVHLFSDAGVRRAIVFTRTKHGANKVTEHLNDSGIRAEAIHGNKSQGARERALAHFKEGSTRALVATDIAARGIDIDDVTHVINFELPNVPESYVHRIGRTARAGASGAAYSFCDAEEREFLIDIERLTKLHLTVVGEHPYRSSIPAPPPTDLVGRTRSASSLLRPQTGARPGHEAHPRGPHGGGSHGGGGGRRRGNRR
ncbi:MAG: DEAD/DEAH box helicase [Myxococcales bacterium]|nr:DEAD/DEAH box helicase [Myxococcales bacterium]